MDNNDLVGRFARRRQAGAGACHSKIEREDEELPDHAEIYPETGTALTVGFTGRLASGRAASSRSS